MGAQGSGWDPDGNNRASPEGVPKCAPSETEHAAAVHREVVVHHPRDPRKLQETGVILEVRYPEWLANPVIVPKKGGKERMCVEFTNLKKACPQDPFPLPHID